MRLTGYRWTSRAETRTKGEVKGYKLLTCHLDADGKLVSEIIEEDKPKRKRGPRRRRKQKKAQKQMAALSEGMRQLIASYSHLSPAQAAALFRDGVLSPASGNMTGSLLARGVDIINPRDWVALWIDRETYRPRKLVFKSILGKEGVQAEVDYEVLPDGTAYPAKTSLMVPQKSLSQTIQTFGHTPKSATP